MGNDDLEMNDNAVERPSDWPRNNRESILDLIDQFCDDFIQEPSSTNKERLIALTTYDPEQNYNTGIFRYTEYESALINTLYYKFKLLNFQHGINFLYDVLWQSALHIKMIHCLPGEKIFDINKCHLRLYPFLKLFFLTGFYYFYEKQRSVADELIKTIDTINSAGLVSSKMIAADFNTVLYDLSSKSTNHCLLELNFPRNDIKKLFLKASELMKKAHISENEQPFSGILRMAISNFILRSRNNYEFDKIYKCVSKAVVDASFENGQLWMGRRSKLNDKREGRAIKEVFSKKAWIEYDWAKSMKFTFERESFTCSFTKELPSETMKKRYGEYVYGYCNDVVGPSITTLKKIGGPYATFSQFIVYDVIYSRKDFKEEMNYLFSIIDSFQISDEEKRHFLEEIIDYWKLSIKDKRWEYEKERRYEIMHFKDYEYSECELTEDFLKNKTPLLLYPDFIIGENHMKRLLAEKAEEKARFQIVGNETIMCKECLLRTHSFSEEKGCEVCGSKDYKILKNR